MLKSAIIQIIINIVTHIGVIFVEIRCIIMTIINIGIIIIIRHLLECNIIIINPLRILGNIYCLRPL